MCCETNVPMLTDDYSRKRERTSSYMCLLEETRALYYAFTEECSRCRDVLPVERQAYYSREMEIALDWIRHEQSDTATEQHALYARKLRRCLNELRCMEVLDAIKGLSCDVRK